MKQQPAALPQNNAERVEKLPIMLGFGTDKLTCQAQQDPPQVADTQTPWLPSPVTMAWAPR